MARQRNAFFLLLFQVCSTHSPIYLNYVTNRARDVNHNISFSYFLVLSNCSFTQLLTIKPYTDMEQHTIHHIYTSGTAWLMLPQLHSLSKYCACTMKLPTQENVGIEILLYYLPYVQCMGNTKSYTMNRAARGSNLLPVNCHSFIKRQCLCMCEFSPHAAVTYMVEK